MGQPRTERKLAAIVAAVALCAAALGPYAPGTQTADKIARIGYLSPAAGPTKQTESFLAGLHEFGYVERQNIVIEYRWAEGKSERLADLASELVRADVDLIVTAGTAATVAATQATRTIAIVFASSADPVEKGIVASLGHPGGNVTGLATFINYAKTLQMLKQAVPEVSRVALLYDPPSKTTWWGQRENVFEACPDGCNSLVVANPSGGRGKATSFHAFNAQRDAPAKPGRAVWPSVRRRERWARACGR
jgi:ABC-type uncharacterized transport system substrate-binding protein